DIMARHNVIIVLMFVGGDGLTQNIVPNPSFENSDSCPVINAHPLTNIIHCNDWFQTNHTYSVDFFHPCMLSRPYDFTPPTTIDGVGEAYDGYGFSGLIPFTFDSQSPEILSVKLTEPLAEDSAYCVSFYYKNS